MDTSTSVSVPSKNMALDGESLLSWLRREGLAGPDEPVAIHQFAHGQSNPTYKLDVGGGRCRYVLRKQPPGTILKGGAHRVDREATVIRALKGTQVPVPRLFKYVEDHSVVGTAFYLCEHVAGVVYQSPLLESLAPTARTHVYYSAARTLGKIHALDVKAAGLGGFGFARGARYNERQVGTWTKQYRAGVAMYPAAAVSQMDQLADSLVSRLPAGDAHGAYGATAGTSGGPRLVHGDFRLDNLIFHEKANLHHFMFTLTLSLTLTHTQTHIQTHVGP